VVMPEEDLHCDDLYLWNRKLCVVMPEDDLHCEGLYLWNRKLYVGMPEDDMRCEGFYLRKSLPLEQEPLCYSA